MNESQVKKWLGVSIFVRFKENIIIVKEKALKVLIKHSRIENQTGNCSKCTHRIKILSERKFGPEVALKRS